ncbi:MAG: hypothetical protein ACYC6M_07985 [Terriglobales bacterium]
MAKCWHFPLSCALLFALGWTPGLTAQTKISSSPQAAAAREQREADDLPAQRAAWFLHARRSPDAQSAAAHRLHAIEQRNAIPFVPRAPERLQSAAGRLPDAAPIPTSGTWSERGPKPQSDPNYGNVAGRVTSVAIDLKNDPSGNTVYVGLAYGGVWKSTNAQSGSPAFVPLSDGLQSLSVGSIALDSTTNPATIYLATGEQNNSIDSYYGVGIFKSANGGQSWSLASSDTTGHSFKGLSFSRILVDAQNPAILLAGAGGGGLATGLNLQRGIYRSADGGATWVLAFQTPAGNSCTDLVYEPTGKAYYAAMRNFGFVKSVDQGMTWTPLPTPFASNVAVILQGGSGTPNFARAALGAQNGVVWSLITDGKGAPSTPTPCTGTSTTCDTGLVQSTNGGTTWTPIAIPTNLYGANSQGFYDLYVAQPPSGTGLIVGGIDTWTTPSINGLNTVWTNTTKAYTTGNVHPDEHALAFIDATHWIVGNDGGAWVTPDGGTTYNNLNATLGGIQFISVSADLSNATLFGGSQDNGTAKGGTGTAWTSIFGGDGGYTGTNPNNTSEYFVENNNVNLQYSLDAGLSFRTVVDKTTISDSSSFYVPYSVFPGTSNQMLLGTTRIWRGPVPQNNTYITGTSWTAVSPTLTSGGFVTGIAIAPTVPDSVYAVTDDGHVVASTNATQATPTFTDVTSGTLGTLTRPFGAVAVHPLNSSIAYVGVQGFATGHVFKTTDAGTSWTDITGNLPDAPVNTILVDPALPNNVYVGSDVGVFVATDGGSAGETWQQVGAGLPGTTVFQLNFGGSGASRVLIAATHGRGAWTIAPLGTATPDFGLTLSPATQSVQPGSNATLTVGTQALNGDTAQISLSCIAPSSGCTFNPGTVSPGASSTLTVAASNLSPGNNTITVKGTDGTNTHTQSATVTVVQPDFTIAASPASVTVNQGGTATYTVTLNSTNSFAGVVSVTCGGNPNSSTCSMSPSTVTLTPGGSGTTSLTVQTQSTVAPGSSTLTVTGTSSISGAGPHTASTTLVVATPTFSVSSTPASATVAAGQPASYTFTVTPSGGFNGTVNLTCSGAPTLASCSLSPASVTISGGTAGSSTLTVTTTARSMIPVLPSPWRMPPTYLWVLAFAAMAMFTRSLRKTTPGRRAWVGATAILGLALLATACGGGGGGGGILKPGTPAGTSTITVTATSGSITQTATVSLTVN